MSHSQLTFKEYNMDDELEKASFLADFFCSELAVEVYKNSVREVTSADRVKYLVSFAESLWRELCLAKSDDTDDYNLDL
jgi:outer membrane phospholipase A